MIILTVIGLKYINFIGNFIIKNKYMKREELNQLLKDFNLEQQIEIVLCFMLSINREECFLLSLEEWTKWAKKWLDNEDRTKEAADKAYKIASDAVNHLPQAFHICRANIASCCVLYQENSSANCTDNTVSLIKELLNCIFPRVLKQTEERLLNIISNKK